MKWIPFELHTHTPHSDGKHTLLEMCLEARRLGIQGIALTDHNTMSGMSEARAVQEETGVVILPGMEWTTFYGHMLTIGAPYCDWRDLGPKDIHKGISRVHQAGGIVGIAHPYRMGSPICTGCHWEYEVENWNDVDYMEVWHELNPSLKRHNRQAMQKWTALLDQGYRITATAGRDWHHSAVHNERPAVTYIELPEGWENCAAESVVHAIAQGRCMPSMGPLLLMEAVVGASRYRVGDEIPIHEDSEMTVTLQICIVRSELCIPYGNELLVTRVVVESNNGILLDQVWDQEQTHLQQQIELEGIRWLRAKAMGVMQEVFTTLVFTNPIYIRMPKSENAEEEMNGCKTIE
ncbi:CehA/McbA family metallohydrolase [Paenibacillus sp. PL2-23]|uniref:CehA/McbA family metallohydrolase n=1 Tax=Paenibacillus sp. PL2-23 TaxID=2100729 RepID=UPI0030FCBF05